MSREQRAHIDRQLRQAPPTANPTPDMLRANFERFMGSFAVSPEVQVRETTLGERPALEVAPTGAWRGGTLLYFHGGGYVFGSPRTALSITAQLVVRTGMRARSLDYRLAPEHPFPAAIEDALRAYRDLLDQGTPAAQIAFAGDSAGGGLTVTTMLAARDAGLPMPGAALAFSPVLDATRGGASMTGKEGSDPIFTREGLAVTTGHYLAGQDPQQPLLSPAVCADLSGLAPTLLQAGSNELLLDDSTRLATRAASAGVTVLLDVTGDVPHVFQSYAGVLDEADLALDRAAAFLRQYVPALP